MGCHEEERVLREAVDVLEDWIRRLPDCSPWRGAFEVIQRDVASCAPPRRRLQLVKPT